MSEWVEVEANGERVRYREDGVADHARPASRLTIEYWHDRRRGMAPRAELEQPGLVRVGHGGRQAPPRHPRRRATEPVGERGGMTIRADIADSGVYDNPDDLLDDLGNAAERLRGQLADEEATAVEVAAEIIRNILASLTGGKAPDAWGVARVADGALLDTLQPHPVPAKRLGSEHVNVPLYRHPAERAECRFCNGTGKAGRNSLDMLYEPCPDCGGAGS